MRYALPPLIIFLFLARIDTAAQPAKPLALTDFLRTFLDWRSLPAYLKGTESAEVSTYDRTGGNDDGFGGQYSFLRRNPDSSLVLFDVKGAGVINRIWTPTPTDDTLDFYLDDDRRAAFSIRYRDLFSGNVFPFVAPLCANQLGGFYCYLPIPFAKSCRIVLRAKHTMFHQIGYRLYPAGTAIKKFSLPLAAGEKDLLADISRSWAEPGRQQPAKFYSGTAQETTKDIFLKPGETATAFETASPGRLVAFTLTSDAPLGATAQNIDLRIVWDGETAPAVYCPLADYFGYAFGKASMQGLLAGTTGNTHYSFFPMPFDRGARIELISRTGDPSGAPVHLAARFTFVPLPRDPGSEGKFYARWNRSNPVPEGKPYTMLDVKGKGHFAGVNLQAQGLRPGITLFFEGDDSTVIDGRMKFHGTGSEDFFNGGWYALLDRWESPMSLPLSGCLDYSIPLCRTGGYRFFPGDKMSFEHSLLQTIEHGPAGNEFPADYRSVAYYYCSENNAQALAPSAANTTVYLPDTMEVYPQLTPLRLDGKATIDPRWAFDLTAQTLFCTVTSETLMQYSLAAIPPGRYRMLFDYSKGPDACRFRLWQRQTPLSEWIDGFAPAETRLPSDPVAQISLTPLNSTFSLQFQTSDGKNKFTLSRIILVREK